MDALHGRIDQTHQQHIKRTTYLQGIQPLILVKRVAFYLLKLVPGYNPMQQSATS